MKSPIDVKAIRAHLQISQLALANRLNVNLRTVVRWEARESKPQGPALTQLRELQSGLHASQRARLTKPFIRFGVCPEFSDTVLPVLGQRAIEALGHPIMFVPLPWDSRMLMSLSVGGVDVILYNASCTRQHRECVGDAVYSVSSPYESGAPYIAFSLPERFTGNVNDLSTADLLQLLWHPDTIKIVPFADMQATMRLIREGCRRSSGELQTFAMADNERNWHRHPAGQGVREFLSPPVWWESHPIAYIGGQDQRAIIEMAAGTTKRKTVFLEDPLVGLDVSVSSELRCNSLVMFGDAPTGAREIVDAFEASRTEVRSSNDMKANAVLEIARWRYLYGSGEGEEFRPTGQEVYATLPRTSALSKELGRWLN